jgi:hypothetical protein
MREVEAHRMAMFPVHWNGTSENSRNKGKLQPHGVESVQCLKFEKAVNYVPSETKNTNPAINLVNPDVMMSLYHATAADCIPEW